MGCSATMHVDDDLAPGQPRVAHQAADDELPRRIDVRKSFAPSLAMLTTSRNRSAGSARRHAREIRLHGRVSTSKAVAMLGRDQDALDLQDAGSTLVHCIGPSPATCRRVSGTGAFALRTSARRFVSRCATGSGAAQAPLSRGSRSGHHSLVARAQEVDRIGVAVLRLVRLHHTRAMSADCSSIATTTPHVSASNPYFARV